MVSEYWLVKANTYDELIPQVNNAIKNGWQPLGGVAIITRPDFVVIVQAVVR